MFSKFLHSTLGVPFTLGFIFFKRCDSLCEDTLNCVKHILYDSTSHENCQYFNYKMISQPNGEDYYISMESVHFVRSLFESCFLANGTTVYSETTKKCIFKDEDGCDYTYYVALDPEQEELKYSLHYPFYNNSLFIELPSTDTRSELSVYVCAAVTVLLWSALNCSMSWVYRYHSNCHWDCCRYCSCWTSAFAPLVDSPQVCRKCLCNHAK